jgi:hypothetical protein
VKKPHPDKPCSKSEAQTCPIGDLWQTDASIQWGVRLLMAWLILSQLFSTLIHLIQIGRMSNHEKELEIMILRYQLAIVERKLQSPPRPSPPLSPPFKAGLIWTRCPSLRII